MQIKNRAINNCNHVLNKYAKNSAVAKHMKVSLQN